jgi:pimeloyl-[acyl-carrier protein] methyl ester esterase
MSTKSNSMRPDEEEAPSAVRGSGFRAAHRSQSQHRVYIETRGRGTDVVLLHGAAMAPTHLRALSDRLCARFRVLTVHRPGYGSSDSVRPYESETCLERIETALVREEVQRPFLVGLSVGADQCMALAVRGRIDARGLVLIGSPQYGGEARRAARAIARTLRAGGDVRSALAERMLGPRATADLRFISEVRNWLSACRGQDLAEELVAVADEFHVHRGEIASLGIPALLRVGTADRMAPTDYIRTARELMRTARVEEVPGAGHALLLEDYEATAASIEHFLLEHTCGLID